jgi:hypothetical protein
VPVETFKFRKKGGFREICIQNSHRIIRVHGGGQDVTCGLDGL